MEGSIVDLSKYRLERAREDFKTANDNFVEGSYRASVNRSYYAIFHALRAITALDQFDSGKHSGIMAYVNQHYVKKGVFDKAFSKTWIRFLDLEKKQIMKIFILCQSRMLKLKLAKRR